MSSSVHFFSLDFCNFVTRDIFMNSNNNFISTFISQIKKVVYLPAPCFVFENSRCFQRAIFIFWKLLPPYFFVQKYFQFFLVDFRHIFWNYMKKFVHRIFMVPSPLKEIHGETVHENWSWIFHKSTVEILRNFTIINKRPILTYFSLNYGPKIFSWQDFVIDEAILFVAFLTQEKPKWPK